MKIAPSLLKNYPDLSKSQKEIIGHIDGPLLVIAGPGSGKTYSIILRALNLLLLEKATPSQLVLCTFTEKAAFEMRDRLLAACKKVGIAIDLSELNVSTIHGFCNKIITKYRHLTPLGHNYDTLDELTQLLFIYDNFDEIIGEPEKDQLFLGKWKTRWTAIEGIQPFFDKITEEMVDPNRLLKAKDDLLKEIGKSYIKYSQLLVAKNRIDFAHLQTMALALLQEKEVARQVINSIRYVLVDEYQDTNYVQEQLLLKLSEVTGNLCVVGDEDQSLYRFRGATVRNILEFPQKVKNCKPIKLTTNYRSHKTIIYSYDKWMASADWTHEDGPAFRYDKTIEPDMTARHPRYPAVLAIWGKDKEDEAKRFAELVGFLKKQKVITDFSQVALLLHSVRQEHSGHYIDALKKKDIKVFCPRARAYFDHEIIRHLVACYAIILGWYGEGRGKIYGSLKDLGEFVDASILEVAKKYAVPHKLAQALSEWKNQINGLQKNQSLDIRPADYLYKLMAYEPFDSVVKDENAARNLAIFSELLNIFQNYYHYTVITYGNREYVRYSFFNSFLRLLYDGGINEYEDRDCPFPKDHVQIMTIHQAKGLEFPVVMVGSLSQVISSKKYVDRELNPFYNRPPFEPEDRITEFDRMRLHYVAFSRPQHLLVLTAHKEPKDHFNEIWQGLPQWPYIEKDQLAVQRFKFKDRMPVKKTYSFTGDLRIYETCPRQYQFYREYDFTPSRSAVIFFGLLVHQTIEEIHRIVMSHQLPKLKKSGIEELFEKTFHFLSLTSDVRPIGRDGKKAALDQVMNYYYQNQEEMKRVIETEVDVSLEKEGYILAGKVDLLLGGDGKLELLDFKTAPRPKESPELLAAYGRQLCTYAHILQERHKKKVDRMILYWTSEPNKRDAVMALPYDHKEVEVAGRHFDEVVNSIENKHFDVRKAPEANICKECDLKTLCHSEGIIKE